MMRAHLALHVKDLPGTQQFVSKLSDGAGSSGPGPRSRSLYPQSAGLESDAGKGRRYLIGGLR